MQKWGITEPSFNYNDLIFALCYGVSDMMSDTMPNYQIYTNDCETPVTEGVLNVVQTVYGDSHDPSGGLGDRTQELKLALDPAILLKSNIYADPVDAKAEGKQITHYYKWSKLIALLMIFYGTLTLLYTTS